MIRSQRRIRVPRPGATTFLDDFSGGLNYRDPAMSLAGNETQDALNVTAIGKTLMKRYGAGTATTLASTGSRIYVSNAQDVAIVQRGSAVYSYDLATWTATQIIANTGGTDKIACCDFQGSVSYIVIAATNGVYTWSFSGSATLRFSKTLTRPTIASWQNKVWVGTDISGNTVYWSAAGDPTTWNSTEDFVSFKEIDGSLIEALGIGSGMDVVGRDGLFVLRGNSGHRIIDSETGEYVTLWAGDGVGGAGHESVTSLDGVIYFQGNNGMYQLVGDTPALISGKIDPVGNWSYSDYLSNCCFALGDRVFFSRELSSSIWEYVPRTGAWWRHSLYTGSVYRHAISAGVRGVSTNAPRAYLIDSGGTAVVDWLAWTSQANSGDDYAGQIVPCSYATPWVSFGLDRARLRRIIVEGWGTNVALSLKSDYQAALTSLDTDMDFATLSSGVFSGSEELWPGSVHRAVSLYFAESGAAGLSGAPQQRSTLDPVAQYVGAFGLNAIRLDTIGLGRG